MGQASSMYLRASSMEFCSDNVKRMSDSVFTSDKTGQTIIFIVEVDSILDIDLYNTGTPHGGGLN